MVTASSFLELSTRLRADRRDNDVLLSLVLCLAAVIMVWINEIRRYFPAFDLKVHFVAKRNVQRQWGEE
jgi:hypothetical protein